ncbi:YdeI/OmpD-associated family protein [Parerythrobacter aurantius]|uniref:YdeI/OmpD-associated family protein n=1 Tax=Parerythrobacter aurantius TaxID=3127706 RepID=UPI0032519C08
MDTPADPGFRHDTPPEIVAALNADPRLKACWDVLTPLARNEWICWTISARQQATRTRRLERLKVEVASGKKRPCCWPGCPHRRESARKWLDA